MSIQRYTNEHYGTFVPCEKGEYVLFTDHFIEMERLLVKHNEEMSIVYNNTVRQINVLKAERDSAIARAEQAEEALRRCLQLADDGVDDPAGPYNVLAHIANTVVAVLFSLPTDASTRSGNHSEDNLTMVGER